MNIISGGYFPFHVGTRSDYRLMWIKIYHEYIFGSAAPPTRRPTDRNIRMNNPVSQGKHHRIVKKILKVNNIRDRMKTITDKAIFTPDPEKCKEYERIDTIQTSSRKKELRKLRRVYMSGVASNPKVK